MIIVYLPPPVVLFRYGHLEAALTMFEKCGSWQIAFAVAFQLQLQPPEILRLARSLSGQLIDSAFSLIVIT